MPCGPTVSFHEIYLPTDYYPSLGGGGLVYVRVYWNNRALPEDPVILHAYGNADDTELIHEHLLDALESIRYHILTFDFPHSGNTRCSVLSSEHTVNATAEVVYDYLTLVMKVPSIIVWGRSIGSSVATYLASTHPTRVSAVILQSAFTSLARHLTYKDAPEVGDNVSLFYYLAEHHDNVGKLDVYVAKAQHPDILLIHGDHDREIPHTHALYLQKRFPNIASLELIERGDHNDLSFKLCGELIVKWLREGNNM